MGLYKRLSENRNEVRRYNAARRKAEKFSSSPSSRLIQMETISEIERFNLATNNLNSIRQLTVQSLLSREDENTFRRSFATIHPSYLPKLRESYPQLTRNEELLAMLICMNQSTDEIALIMGINRNSVNVVRSRMRKNMELPKEKSLDEVLKQYLT